MSWSNLVGKRISGFRGYKEKQFGKDKVTVSFILFDDRETFLELREQDAYDYHDCCNSARIIDMCKDAKLWEIMYREENGFLESTTDTSCPF